MKPLGLLALLSVGVLGAEDTDWDRFFQGAWDRGFVAREVAWALVGASARLRAEEARWLPSISLSTDASRPQQVSVRALDGFEMVSWTLSSALAQRLPGGGALKFTTQWEPSWTTLRPHAKPEGAPTLGLQATLPLIPSPSLELARLAYEQEVFEQGQVRRRGWLELVGAASEVDLGRLAVVARRAREAVAIQKAAGTTFLRSQGRTSDASLATDQAAVVRARWETVQAEAALELAEGAWRRLGGSNLPPIEEGGLLAWAGRDHGPRLDDGEIEGRRLQARWDDLSSRERVADLGPVLGWGFSVSRPGGHDAVVSLELGLSFGTDVLVVGPAIDAVRRAGVARGDLLVEEATEVALDRAQHRDLFLREVRTVRAAIEANRRAVQQARDAVVDVVQKGEAPRSEALEAEALVAEMSLLVRRLVWEEVLEVGFR